MVPTPLFPRSFRLRHWGLAAGLVAASCAGASFVPGSAARAGEDGVRAGLEGRLAALAERDAGAAVRLALELEAAGASDLAAQAYERAVAVDADHRVARRALGYERVGERWLRGDDLMRAKGFIRHAGTWMMAEAFAAATRPERDRAEQKAGEARVRLLLEQMATGDEDGVRSARRRFALEDARFKLAPLAMALRVEPPSLRVYAAEELGKLGDLRAAPALLKRAIYDPEAQVREAVVDALREFDAPETVHPLGRALGSLTSETRVRSAEALARLGDVSAMGYILHRWHATSGDFPRVYFASLTQVSYVQDFDVEVAQTSFIADPVVGVLQEGFSHAVKVLGAEHGFTTVERVGLHKSMVKLAGMDLGQDPQPWLRFWKEEGERLESEQAARRRAKRAQ